MFALAQASWALIELADMTRHRHIPAFGPMLHLPKLGRLIGYLAIAVLCALPMIAQSKELHRWHGFYGGPSEPGSAIVANQLQWRQLWKRLGRNDPPPFDEKHQSGVGIFLGTRLSGGYGIRIVSMEPHDNRYVVAFEEAGPGNEMVTQALTTPWLVLLIERPASPIVVESRRLSN
jgi:hypothetical protein